MRATNETSGPDAPEIPDKLYFRIGEVARVAGIKQHVLRYWETEFPSIAPQKSRSGHRLYRRKDVELILEIKRLLYEQRFTIEGARKHLRQRGKRALSAKSVPRKPQRELFLSASDPLDQVKQELREILKLLDRKR